MPNHGHDGPAPVLLARHSRSGGAHVGYRRVTGVHRAEGLAGPTRRYLFTVALLAGTSSLPILAAIGSGSATVADGMPPAGVTPFIPPPSGGPLVVVPPPTAVAPDPAGTLDRALRSGWLPLPLPAAGWPADATSSGTGYDRTPDVRPGPNEPGEPGPVPSPSPSPLPTGSPSPTPPPSPSPGPSYPDPSAGPTDTAGPSAGPTDTAGPAPTAPSPLPAPTGTPATPEPTVVPEPTTVPEPPAAPEPTAVPEPTTVPGPAPAPAPTTPSSSPAPAPGAVPAPIQAARRS